MPITHKSLFNTLIVELIFFKHEIVVWHVSSQLMNFCAQNYNFHPFLLNNYDLPQMIGKSSSIKCQKFTKQAPTH